MRAVIVLKHLMALIFCSIQCQTRKLGSKDANLSMSKKKAMGLDLTNTYKYDPSYSTYSNSGSSFTTYQYAYSSYVYYQYFYSYSSNYYGFYGSGSFETYSSNSYYYKNYYSYESSSNKDSSSSSEVSEIPSLAPINKPPSLITSEMPIIQSTSTVAPSEDSEKSQAPSITADTDLIDQPTDSEDTDYSYNYDDKYAVHNSGSDDKNNNGSNLRLGIPINNLYIVYSVGLGIVVILTSLYIYRICRESSSGPSASSAVSRYERVSTSDASSSGSDGSKSIFSLPTAKPKPPKESERDIELARFQRMAGSMSSYPAPNNSNSSSNSIS